MSIDHTFQQVLSEITEAQPENMVVTEFEREMLHFLAAWDEETGKQWSDIKGPVITKTLRERFSQAANIVMGRFEKLGWVVRVSRQELRTRTDSWWDNSLGQPWSQPWRLTDAGRSQVLH
jgi:hypothetical protein